MREETGPPEKTRPTILLVEEDDHARPALKSRLRGLGYRVLVAVDAEDAREWVGAGLARPPDLVLINLVRRSPEEALGAGRELRRHIKYDGQTPLVVMPERVPEELEGTDVHAGGNDWICYYDDGEQLRTLVGRLTGNGAA